jgi:hypothetical protein
MKRSSIVAGSLAAALLVAAPLAEAAPKPPVAQYLGTVKGGGKFVVDVNGGKVTTVQAYYPVVCQTPGPPAGGGEILVENLNVKLKRSAKGIYSFTLKLRKGEQNGNPAGTIKGTWNKGNTKVTGTITLAGSAYATACAENGGAGTNPPAAFTATQQGH